MNLVPPLHDSLVDRALDAGKRQLDGEQGLLHVCGGHDDAGNHGALGHAVYEVVVPGKEGEAHEPAPHLLYVRDPGNEGVGNGNGFADRCIFVHDLPAPHAEAKDGRFPTHPANQSSDNNRLIPAHGYSILTPPDVPSHLRVGRLPCNTPEAPANLFSPWTVTPAPAWRAIK